MKAEGEANQATEPDSLFARLDGLILPLISAGWRERERSDWYDPDLGLSAMATLERVQEVLDIELFSAGWLQVFAYAADFEPDPDEPDQPILTIDDPGLLQAECRARGWVA